MKSKPSLDFDGLSFKLIKNVDEDISIPSTEVVNLSLLSGTVPNAMKVAKVILIFKSGNENIFCNYQPISKLPVIYKILEQAINVIIRYAI